MRVERTNARDRTTGHGQGNSRHGGNCFALPTHRHTSQSSESSRGRTVNTVGRCTQHHNLCRCWQTQQTSTRSPPPSLHHTETTDKHKQATEVRHVIYVHRLARRPHTALQEHRLSALDVRRDSPPTWLRHHVVLRDVAFTKPKQNTRTAVSTTTSTTHAQHKHMPAFTCDSKHQPHVHAHAHALSHNVPPTFAHCPSCGTGVARKSAVVGHHTVLIVFTHAHNPRHHLLAGNRLSLDTCFDNKRVTASHAMRHPTQPSPTQPNPTQPNTTVTSTMVSAQHSRRDKHLRHTPANKKVRKRVLARHHFRANHGPLRTRAVRLDRKRGIHAGVKHGTVF